MRSPTIGADLAETAIVTLIAAWRTLAAASMVTKQSPASVTGVALVRAVARVAASWAALALVLLRLVLIAIAGHRWLDWLLFWFLFLLVVTRVISHLIIEDIVIVLLLRLDIILLLRVLIFLLLRVIGVWLLWTDWLGLLLLFLLLLLRVGLGI